MTHRVRRIGPLLRTRPTAEGPNTVRRPCPSFWSLPSRGRAMVCAVSFASVFASVEDTFDDITGSPRHSSVIVPELLLRMLYVAEHAGELRGLVAVDRKRVARRPGEQIAVVPCSLAQPVRGEEMVGVVGVERAEHDKCVERAECRRDAHLRV